MKRKSMTKQHVRRKIQGGGAPGPQGKKSTNLRLASGPFSAGDGFADTIDAAYAPIAHQAGAFSRWTIPYHIIARLAVCFDFVLIVSSATLSGLFYHHVAFGDAGVAWRNLDVSVFVAAFFIFLANLRKLYDPTRLLDWSDQLQNVLLIWGATFVFLGGVVFSLGMSRDASRGALLFFAVSGLIVLLAHRLFWHVFIDRALAKGSLRGRKTVVIGTDLPRSLANSLRLHGFKVERQFNIEGSSPADLDESIAPAISFIWGSDVEEIFLIDKTSDARRFDEIVHRLRVLPIPVTLIADDAIAQLVRHSWRPIGDSVAIQLQRPPLTNLERIYKRTIDIMAASCGLIVFLPLFVLVAIAIKADSRGPVIFRQTRKGFNGKPFRIFKFRSMSVLEDGATIIQATQRDRRVTRVGALLRSTSIDEIPQLINVLCGDMSIVGPRPHAVAHDDHFTKLIENYAYRHHVKPGMTGWAQVSGYRGETRTLDKMQRRIECDLWYINHWNIWLDFVIILRTLGEVMRRENAY